MHAWQEFRSIDAGTYGVDANGRYLDRQGTRQGFDSSADTCDHCPSLVWALACDSGCEHDRAVLADMRACVLDRSQDSPIAQLKSLPGFGKVRRCKLIQLQRVAGSEDQVIEITDLLKEILNVALIREIKRVPFRFSVERCDRLFNSIRIARRNDCLCPLSHSLLCHC